MDAGEFYALLRFEEAARAMRVTFALDIVERIGDRALSTNELQNEFQFTPQAVRTFFALLRVMNVVTTDAEKRFRVSPAAHRCLASKSAFSRRPYLAMGSDDADEFIKLLRGDLSDRPTALYGRENENSTLMDVEEVAREISFGLASRAKSFSEPLAQAIHQKAEPTHRIFADLGAGSPYLANACRNLISQFTTLLLVDRSNGMKYIRQMCQRDAIDTCRLEFREQDFFSDVPVADVYVLSNTAHDWLPSEYQEIMSNVRAAISPGGFVCIHEPLLVDNWNNKSEWFEALWMACYAVTLFRLTLGKGSCYSVDEHDTIQQAVGLTRRDVPIRTVDGCTALFYHPSE